MKNTPIKLLLLPLLLILSACGSNENNDGTSDKIDEEVKVQMYFEELSSEQTGIDFENAIIETEARNYYNFEYMYNGGGVSVGDINNDGLVDLFFTGNEISDKLYLNKGDMVFEDITSAAFQYDLSSGWHTGVNMVDVNADGFLDIYICRSGNTMDKSELSNLLFINNQNNTFTEKASEYGIAGNKRSTHSTFFDYDNDGDLDLYVMNHPLADNDKFYSYEELIRKAYEGEQSDVFYRNDDGVYKDVSSAAGIRCNSYGLGIAASDLDNDGYMDLYISSDYSEPDFMYMNQGDGSFKEEILERTNHTSNFSMGNDVADINNDGLLDIFTLDMVSEDHIRSKKNMGGMSRENFLKIVNMNFHHQYMFNGLQLNNGNGTFSEIGQLAGISKTDWSWSVLLADFDNDGFKDIFVTNGFKREVRDNDYVRKYKEKKEKNELGDFEYELNLIPATKTENYAFKNTGNLKFEKVTSQWGLDKPVNSNGAVYADLDNDGDLDLVVNNMDDKAAVFENKLMGGSNNFIRLKVDGYGSNKQAIGAKVTLYTGAEKQYQEVQFSRGYISSVDQVLHFGLGATERIDKITVEWPDGKVLEIDNAQINTTLIVDRDKASNRQLVKSNVRSIFREITDSLLQFEHKEIPFNDFETEILLPNQLSQSGPFIAKGDVNGDGMEDLYITGPRQGVGKMFIQNERGFQEKTGPWNKQKDREEQDALFFDADNDGDLDLYVVSGGNEHFYDSKSLIDQLYINDGDGNFQNESNRLPQVPCGGQSVIAGDYDNDGDLDLFVGGRQIPGFYPLPPKSYLLENNKGFFKDVSLNSPDLAGYGLITDAIFDDFDQDDDLDLVVVGEWMPVSFFENNDGVFTNVTANKNPNQATGWYCSIEKGDLNGDGKMDYIIGNVGENNKFHPSSEKPLELYYNDFDGNGMNDIVLGKYQNNICYPVRGRQCSSEQMPFIKEKFPTYSDFATADLTNIYGKENIENSLHLSATDFSSVVFLSSGIGYTVEKLPVYCQFGPINRSIFYDYNKDGHLDVLTVGNNFGVEVETIRYDGGRGVLLLGDGKGGLKQLTPIESGFFENQDCKDMVQLNRKGHQLVITVSNNSRAKTFLLQK